MLLVYLILRHPSIELSIYPYPRAIIYFFIDSSTFIFSIDSVIINFYYSFIHFLFSFTFYYEYFRRGKKSEPASRTFKVLEDPPDLTDSTTLEESDSTLVSDIMNTGRTYDLAGDRRAMEQDDDDLTQVTAMEPPHRWVFFTILL